MMVTEQDRVIVQGRYLVYEQDPSRRFHMRGMAFPVPLHEELYDEQGWIAVLKQLRQASPYINTLRLYRVHGIDEPRHHDVKREDNVAVARNDPTIMDGFYQAAAELGFYLLVPLTAVTGDGVLDRSKDAPKCYSAKLFRYGAQVLDSVQPHPNVLGGVLGNEVLNSLHDWPAAPCLLAYARDLKRYRPNFPLVYTTQHDGLTAVVTPGATAQLLLNYLTCHIHDFDDDTVNDSSSSLATIDILGINIESWCSSLQSFEQNDDGSKGSYLDIYEHLHNATIPLIFSEVGCSQILYNRDNGLGVSLGFERTAREWHQVSVIETVMADEWSGYIAYAYDGPVDFRMTTGGPWDGVTPLMPNRDMENYIQALEEVGNATTTSSMVASTDSMNPISPPSCASVHDFLQDCCQVNLMDVRDIPSYFIDPGDKATDRWAVHAQRAGFRALATWGCLSIVTILGALWYALRRPRTKLDPEEAECQTLSTEEPSMSYDTFA